MMALTRLFYLTAKPRLSSAVGVLVLLALPALSRWGDPSYGWSVVVGAVIGVMLLSAQMPLNGGTWILILPADTRRIYSAIHLAFIASAGPGLLCIAGGIVLAGMLSPLVAAQGLCTAALVMTVIFALLPMFWTWPLLFGSPIVLIIAGVLSGVGAVVMPGFNSAASMRMVVGIMAVELLLIVPIYLAGRWWFARFDPVRWSLRWPGRKNTGRVPVAESSTPRASNAGSPGLRGLSPSHPGRTLLPPAARLFIRVCWLRWGFFWVCVVALFGALVVNMPFQGDMSNFGLLWMLILAVNAPTAMLWLRNQLDVLLPLRRGSIYQAFTMPVLIAMFAVSLAVGLAARSVEPTEIYTVSQSSVSQSWEFFGPRAMPKDFGAFPGSGIEESPQAWRRRLPIIAEQATHVLANRYGVTCSAKDLVNEKRPGATVVTTAPVIGKLRTAARWQAIDRALAVMVVILLGAAFGMLGPWVQRRPRLARVFRWIIVGILIAAFALVYWPWLYSSKVVMMDGVPLIPLGPQAMVRQLMFDYRYAVAAGLALLAVGLHWRNHRAFINAEWGQLRTKRLGDAG